MDFSKLTALMEHFTSWRIPGCSAEVYLHGEKVFSGSSGFADCENGIKMSPDSLMYMYSASKPITCAAALTLWEAGKFLLTDPVEKYIPEWADMQVETEKDGEKILVPARRKITVGDLFSMTSGLDYNTERPGISGAVKKYSPVCKTADIIRGMGSDPLIFHPGEKWNYGLSHDVIGGLIEIITGMSLKDYAKKVIFEPLGMEESYYGGWDIPENLAIQYEFIDAEDRYVRSDQKNHLIFGSEFYSGGAGIISTVADMAKFSAVMSMKGKTSDGKRILAPSTVDLMRRNRLSPEQRVIYNWDGLQGYGYGLGVRTLMDKAAAGSPSAVGEFGWTGAAGAYMMIDPENELSLFYAHHMLNNQEPYTSPRLRNVLYSCLD